MWIVVAPVYIYIIMMRLLAACSFSRLVVVLLVALCAQCLVLDAAAWSSSSGTTTTASTATRRQYHHCFRSSSSSTTTTTTTTTIPNTTRRRQSSIVSTTTITSPTRLYQQGTTPGADIEQPPVDAPQEEKEQPSSSSSSSTKTSAEAASGSDIPLSLQSRGKVNEIDFCIAPADVSLSRAYGISSSSSSSTTTNLNSSNNNENDNTPILSLTRALNNASNRAVRRILLARSWPSAEALNQSLRQVAAYEKERAKLQAAGDDNNSSGAKCPVPRPILNVLMRRRKNAAAAAAAAAAEPLEVTSTITTTAATPQPRRSSGRTNEEYVADQIRNFSQRYGHLPGYEFAQDYLKAILSLATTGVESDTVPAIMQAAVYDESYKRVLAVLNTVGVVLEPMEDSDDNNNEPTNYAAGTRRRKIASKLVDRDFCLSMMDQLQMRHEQTKEEGGGGEEQQPEPSKSITVAVDIDANEKEEDAAKKKSDDDKELTKEDLGGVLLSATEPSMTRQLNTLANIVERALLFGGDQELLVLAETLDADRAAFIERWHPESSEKNFDNNNDRDSQHKKPRTGVQFLDCMIRLLRTCYDNGVTTTLEPALPLPTSYANAYERLMASAVQLGSGYVKPAPTNIMTLPKPRTPKEELGRFAVWESTFRQQSSSPDVSTYPDDLVGTWEVRDLIGGETIGVSTVVLNEDGNVEVKEPLEGLRWRLDPGPTHLDTCTFQVLSSDGTILQYRGFIDRGARLEARFSNRSISIRGSVMFQMRDGGSVDYYKDILPINYRTGTTKFVMTKTESKNS